MIVRFVPCRSTEIVSQSDSGRRSRRSRRQTGQIFVQVLSALAEAVSALRSRS